MVFSDQDRSEWKDASNQGIGCYKIGLVESWGGDYDQSCAAGIGARSWSHHLLIIYIIDLDENMGSMIGKFADYTKFGGEVDSEEGCTRI